VADVAGEAVFTPFTLPGELVRAARRGRRATLLEVVEPSPERVAPACTHFGVCGGCSLQHWASEPYLAWKSGLLQAALHRAGYDGAELPPVARTGPAERRRVDLALRRAPGGGVTVGLHRTGGETFDMHQCPVLHPGLFALVAPLRVLLHGLGLLKREGSALLNLLDTGPDLLLRTDAEPTPVDRARVADFARAHAVPRISWTRGEKPTETLAMLGPSSETLSGAIVSPPPGAFLQASRPGQEAIVAAVLAGLPDKLTAKSRVAELYAGCGAITFALARRVGVAAFEGDEAACAALRSATAGTRVTAERRDLVRQPLSAKELSKFAAVVLDPPYAGASAQMAEIAASRVRVIYVSCHPAALARDAAVLQAAGYRLLSAAPIDQFLWSARLESVCVFAR
jgi:23S rRNA (uracil1939-C5)-methyltransferase